MTATALVAVVDTCYTKYVSTTTNQERKMHRYEHLNREAKVNRLVSVLHSSSGGRAGSETVALLSQSRRDEICRLAGERPASETTWRSIVREIEDAERIASRKAALWVANEAVAV